MAELLAKSPAAGLLPLEVEGSRLDEYAPEAITWVACFNGQSSRVSDDLSSKTGCAFPEPNRFTAAGDWRAISTAPEEALVLGKPVAVEGAALSDQSDGWALLHLSGPDARDVLERVTPVDVRPNVFHVGHTARTLVGHMTASLSRLDDDLWEVIVFRSMAKTAVHDLSRAMKAVAAQKAL